MGQPLGRPKEEFLASVRQALGRAPGTADNPSPPEIPALLAELEEQAGDAQRRAVANRDALVPRFLETAALRGWKVHRAANSEDALGYITGLATSQGVDKIVRSRQEMFHDLDLDTALLGMGISVTPAVKDERHSREAIRGEIAAAGMGVTGVDYAVAETGSVIVLPRPGLSRLVSLVPPVHVAIARSGDIVESLDEVFLLRRLEYYRHGGDMGRYLNFITGPSRTADIEQTLAVGVHGPREVHLVFLE